MAEIESLEEAMKCAETILTKDKNDGYLNAREIIDNLFEPINSDKQLEKETVFTRLCVLDSLYATQMGKRLYGLQDLAKNILEFGGSTDNQLNDKLKNYKDYVRTQSPAAENDYKSILDLFDTKYGIKTNEKAEDNYDEEDEKNKVAHAHSLISKYFYFVSGHKFPIYDRLVKNNISDVLNALPEDKKSFNKSWENKKASPKKDDKQGTDKKILLLNAIIKFFENENDDAIFSRFDNLLWLFGKIREYSFASFVTKETYMKILKVSKEDINTQDNKEKSKKRKIKKEKNAEVLQKLGQLNGIKLFTNEDVNNEFERFLKFMKRVLSK